MRYVPYGKCRLDLLSAIGQGQRYLEWHTHIYLAHGPYFKLHLTTYVVYDVLFFCPCPCFVLLSLESPSPLGELVFILLNSAIVPPPQQNFFNLLILQGREGFLFYSILYISLL